jgi:hypothetical protein
MRERERQAPPGKAMWLLPLRVVPQKVKWKPRHRALAEKARKKWKQQRAPTAHQRGKMRLREQPVRPVRRKERMQSREPRAGWPAIRRGY